jgi:hypothetical protein
MSIHVFVKRVVASWLAGFVEPCGLNRQTAVRLIEEDRDKVAKDERRRRRGYRESSCFGPHTH